MQKYNILSGILSLVLALNVPLQAQTSQPDAAHQQQTKTLALALGVTSALAVVAVIAFAAGKSNALANVRQRRKIVFKDEHSYLNEQGKEELAGMIDNDFTNKTHESNLFYKPLNETLNTLRAQNKGAIFFVEIKNKKMKRYVLPTSHANQLDLRIRIESNAVAMDDTAADALQNILHPVAALHDKFKFPKVEDLQQASQQPILDEHELDGFWGVSLDDED